MKFLMILAGALTLATSALAQTPDARAFSEAVAAALHEKTPLALAPGFVMTKASVETGVVVVLVEYRGEDPIGSGEEAAQEMGRGFATGLCQSGDGSILKAFENGLVMRPDLLLPDGKRVKGPAVDRCSG